MLVPYTVPTPADLKQRYAAFADTDEGAIEVWITDAQRVVTQSWPEGDYAPGILSLAAHSLTLQGFGASGAAQLPAGVTRFRSGAMDVSVSEKAANVRATGGYGATIYGQEFQAMLRRNVGGMRLVSAGHALVGC